MPEEPALSTIESLGRTIITCSPMVPRSFSQPYQPVVPPVERPGFTMITTPIDALAVSHLVPFLHAHGVSVEAVGENQTYLARLPSGKRRIRTFRIYRLTFPDGMKRLDGPSTRWLVPFTLLFPDGARLQGRINTIPDPEEIILGFPLPQTGSQDE